MIVRRPVNAVRRLCRANDCPYFKRQYRLPNLSCENSRHLRHLPLPFLEPGVRMPHPGHQPIAGRRGNLLDHSAGLDKDVTRAESAITWCCDLGGERLGRNRGDWYIKWSEGL